jgi:transcriptional regulator with GAF, ATPase, and Fis domain
VDSALPLLGNSRAMLDVIEDAQTIAATDSKVLITGESGVGKELLARLIHRRSLRSHAPIVTINCAGVPETLLESELFGHVRGSFTDAHRDRRGFLEIAHGGTVLLDEVGEMSLRMQGLLLRFLENGEIQRIGSERPQTLVDVRVIAATNRNLLEAVRRKEFREDLFYRLNIVHLIIPPLRERREDIKLLFEHYVEEHRTRHRMAPCQLTPEAMARLETYHWPGNVRELKNVAERLVLHRSGRVVAPGDLPLQVDPTEPLVGSSGSAANTPEAIAASCYQRMAQGQESFWSVVYEPFMLRDMTRETVRAVVRRGLEHTKGSYRLVAQLFNLPPTDYKRFLNFLQKYDCHMAFQKFRVVSAPPSAESRAPRVRDAKAV